MKDFFYKLGLLTIPSVLWAGNFVFARYMREDFYPYDLAFFRWSVALVVVWLVYGRFFWGDMSSHWKAFRREVKVLVLLALMGVVGYNTILYYGLNETTALNAAFINAVLPLEIIVLSWILFQVRPDWRQWLAIGLSLAGVGFILTGGDFQVVRTLEFRRGDLMVLGSATTWAIYSVWVKRIGGKFSPQIFILMIITLGWLMMVPGFMYRVWGSWNDTLTFGIQAVNGRGILFIIYLGCFPSVVAYRVFNECITVLGPNLSGLSLNFLPLFVVLAAIFFLGESFVSSHLIGGLFIIFSLLLVFIKKRKLKVAV